MGQVHDAIELRGKQGALALDYPRPAVEAAATYMADEDAGIGFLYSGWCQAALPHKRLPDDQGWQIQGERVTLVVQPGMVPAPDGKPKPVGVPYGSRARLIMLYMQSEALRTGRREIMLGKSMTGWLRRMGVPPGGKSILQVKDQCDRIFRCRLSFDVRSGSRSGFVQQLIVDKAIFLEDDSSRPLFSETATLSETFFEQLKKHPVPLEEAAIRAISNNSMALDIYAWLAYRLHALAAPRPITWVALKGQFGTGFVRLDNFRASFLENLSLALAVYRTAGVESDERGLVLRPSRPPVAKT